MSNVNSSLIEDNVANLNLFDGFNLNMANNIMLLNNIGNKNQFSGIELYNTYNCSLISNTGDKNIRDGFNLNYSFNNTLKSNTANNNTYSGFFLGSVSNITLVNNEANSNKEGFSLGSSNSNILLNNMAFYNSFYGFVLDSSKTNKLENNTAKYNSINSFIKKSSVNNNLIQNNFPDTTMASPPVLSYVKYQNKQVSFAWFAPEITGGSLITSYNIYRAINVSSDFNTDSFELLNSTNKLQYNDTTIVSNGSYYYQVRAVNGVQEGLPVMFYLVIQNIYVNQTTTTTNLTSKSTLLNSTSHEPGISTISNVSFGSLWLGFCTMITLYIVRKKRMS